MSHPEFYSRYYQDTPVMQGWPFRVWSLGHAEYAPHMPFPSGNHPSDHLFSWEGGRMLSTLTLVYISEGGGQFRSSPSGLLDVRPNTVMIVHPHVWHAYCPDVQTGWREHWVEIAADAALPLLNQAGVTPERPLKLIGAAPRLSQLYQELYDLSRIEAYGVEQELAALAYQILAHLLALWQSHVPHVQHFAVVERMRQYLLSDLSQTASVHAAAARAGLSASRLRVLFKQATGLSPKQYQLEARVARAERLLSGSTLPVSVVAEQTGFESVYHFSRQFKRMRGITATDYRSALKKASVTGA